MKQTVYNKLVRDKILKIIRANGGMPETCTLGDREYIPELIKKLREETAEFAENTSLEELADIQEVVLALCNAVGHTRDELEKARANKAEAKGVFGEKVYLERVNE